MEEDKNQLTAAEERHKEMSISWLKERDELKKDIAALKRSKEKDEEDIKLVQKNLQTAVSIVNDRPDVNVCSYYPTRSKLEIPCESLILQINDSGGQSWKFSLEFVLKKYTYSTIIIYILYFLQI